MAVIVPLVLLFVAWTVQQIAASPTARPCHLLGCTEYGRTDHHHHWAYGHEDTHACHCANGYPR